MRTKKIKCARLFSSPCLAPEGCCSSSSSGQFGQKYTDLKCIQLWNGAKRSQLSQSHSQQLSGQIGTFFFNKDSIFSSWLPIHEQLFPRSSKKICKKISIVSLTKYDQENMILFPLVLEYRDRRNVKKNITSCHLSICLCVYLCLCHHKMITNVIFKTLDPTALCVSVIFQNVTLGNWDAIIYQGPKSFAGKITSLDDKNLENNIKHWFLLNSNIPSQP